ncbi:hypothetical protein ACULNC_05255 [Shigella flexneri]
MQSLTSFVGVDGTNPSLNSARLQINLKPLDERDDRVQKVIARLQTAVIKCRASISPATNAGPDHRYSGQPHPVPVYLAGHVTGCAGTWVPQLMENSSNCHSFLMSPATGRTKGWWRMSMLIATAPAVGDQHGGRR